MHYGLKPLESDDLKVEDKPQCFYLYETFVVLCCSVGFVLFCLGFFFFFRLLDVMDLAHFAG